MPCAARSSLLNTEKGGASKNLPQASSSTRSARMFIACIGGVSKVNAAMATELLISLYHPDLVLNVGVLQAAEKGSIKHRFVLAETFLQHDVDTCAVGPIRPTLSPPSAGQSSSKQSGKGKNA